MLAGVLFDVEGENLRVVATDRYRMAVARAHTFGHEGPRTQVITPLPLVDAMRALLGAERSVRLTVDGDRMTLEAEDRQAAGRCLDHDFPDYRRLADLPAGRRVPVDAAAFRRMLLTGPVRASEVREQDQVPYDLSVLDVSEDGTVTVREDGDDGGTPMAFNREILLQAVAADAREELLLEFGATTAPLVIRRPDDEHSFSLLMPVRLDD